MTNNNLTISYTENKQNKQLNFRIKREGLQLNHDLTVKTSPMLKDNKGNRTTQIINQGNAGHEFSITFYIYHVDTKGTIDKTQIKNDIKAIVGLYKESTPVKLVIPPSLVFKTFNKSEQYVILDKTFTEDVTGIVECELQFHTYNPPKTVKLLDTKTDVLAVNFKKCKSKIKKMKYNKKTPVKSECILNMKKILASCGYDVYERKKMTDKEKKACKKKNKKKDWKKKCTSNKTKKISNVYDKRTVKALLKFKKDWNKYVYADKNGVNKKNKKGKNPYKKFSKVTSKSCKKVDKQTWEYLCKYSVLKKARKGK